MLPASNIVDPCCFHDLHSAVTHSIALLSVQLDFFGTFFDPALVRGAGMLSPGELQRLSIARVLYHHPLLAVMDEPVSAVGTSAGIDMLKLLQHHSITTIVTGQADSPLIHNNVSETFFALVISL